MKHFLFLLISFFCFLSIYAQSGNYPECDYTYFKDSKKISTSLCYDKEKKWGKARAYDLKGNLIYEKGLRNFAGHSSVHFSYYPNGAISKAEWSSAPDGGIQWYKSVDEFSPDGKLTKHWDWNNDFNNMTTIVKAPEQYNIKPDTLIKPQPKEKKKEAEVMECAEIYSSEFYFINKTKYKLRITCQHKFIKEEKYSIELTPGDTIKGGQHILAEQYENPIGKFNISIAKRNKKPKGKFTFSAAQDGIRTPKKGLRKYYYEVRKS